MGRTTPRDVDADSLAVLRIALQEVVKGMKGGPNSGSLVLQVADAMVAPSQTEFRARVAQLPVTVAVSGWLVRATATKSPGTTTSMMPGNSLSFRPSESSDPVRTKGVRVCLRTGALLQTASRAEAPDRVIQSHGPGLRIRKMKIGARPSLTASSISISAQRRKISMRRSQ